MPMSGLYQPWAHKEFITVEQLYPDLKSNTALWKILIRSLTFIKSMSDKTGRKIRVERNQLFQHLMIFQKKTEWVQSQCFPRGLDFCHHPQPCQMPLWSLVGNRHLLNQKQHQHWSRQKSLPQWGAQRDTLDSTSNLLCCAESQLPVQLGPAKSLKELKWHNFWA